MVEAAVRGIVDFSQAKFYDPAWRRRVMILVGGMQGLNYREELKLSHNYYLSLMALPKLPPETVTRFAQALDAAYDKLRATYRPWQTPVSEEEAKSAESKKFQDQWERCFGGKLEDPETQQRIARTAQAMRKRREMTAKEITPDDILADPKKRAEARERTGQSRRTRNDAIGRQLSGLRRA
jgi:hypothetical protein